MVYIEIQDTKLKFRMKKLSYKLFRLIGTQLIIKNRIAAKINKRKKAITWPFEAQIASPFFQYLMDIIG